MTYLARTFSEYNFRLQWRWNEFETSENIPGIFWDVQEHFGNRIARKMHYTDYDCGSVLFLLAHNINKLAVVAVVRETLFIFRNTYVNQYLL